MFNAGDMVMTDWEGKNPSVHTITAYKECGTYTQSGKAVQVQPALQGLTPNDWIDVGWFTPSIR